MSSSQDRKKILKSEDCLFLFSLVFDFGLRQTKIEHETALHHINVLFFLPNYFLKVSFVCLIVRAVLREFLSQVIHIMRTCITTRPDQCSFDHCLHNMGYLVSVSVNGSAFLNERTGSLFCLIITMTECFLEISLIFHEP